jgi:dTDP-4-amino-4,6-dideoxygalactose transaminase
MHHLEKRGITAGVHYPIPVHLQPAYKGRLSHSKSMKMTEHLSKRILSLPLYPELDEKAQQRVIETVLEFQESK